MADYQAGFNCKGRINGGAYAIASYRCRDTYTDQDVSNTEGIVGNRDIPSAAGAGGTIAPNAESRMAGLGHMEAEVRNATFDVLANPFATPVSPPNGYSAGTAANPSNYVYLQIFVNGAGGLSWYSPSFLVLEGAEDMDIQRLQPVTFSGRSDGWYHTPYM